MSHEINPIDGATLVGLAALIVKDGWRWLRNGRGANVGGATAIQLARLEARFEAMYDRLERIETKLDRV